MILPNGAILAVVDGKRLQLFRKIGHEPQINLAGPAVPDIAAASGGTGGRHRNSAANPARHRLDEDDFAAAAAGYLNAEALSGRIGQLVVVADPRTLGELRKHYHDVLAARLVGEIGKHLTERSAQTVAEAITAA